jgi:tyrosyl-tRNA synthetase
MQKRLARAVVALLHGPNAAQQAQEEFERVFQRREEPESSATLVAWESLPRMIAVAPPGPILVTPEEAADLAEAIKYGQENPSIKLATFLNQQLGVSLSQARRLIEQGAVSIDGERCENLFPHIHPGSLIRVGKSQFFRIEPPK